MKPFIFISDFDGTMTEKDFYKIIVDDYIGDDGRNYCIEWRKNNKVDIVFLNKIFSWHPFCKEELEELLGKVQLDEGTKRLCDYVAEKQGDFLVLSAGFNYYIERILKREKLDHLEVITNPGVYQDHIFIMNPDDQANHYSPLFGVDKEKVILEKRKEYELVIFAGDSEPDLKAALSADIVFAKGELRGLLGNLNVKFYPINHFDEAILVLKSLI